MRFLRKLRLAIDTARRLGPAGLAGLPFARRTIARSPLFDARWYLDNNPDVAAAGADPALHYLLFGGFHGRSASPAFVSDEYLAINPDVRAAGINPLLHYERRGRGEGRAISTAPVEDAGYAAQQASFPARCAALSGRLARGERLDAVFLVSEPSMFPALPLFVAMRRHPAFSPRIVAIPDLRWRDGRVDEDMERCRAALAAVVPPGLVSKAGRGADGEWEDVLDGADLVCYPSPYEFSSFRYNPRYSLGRRFLPFSVNYGFFRSLYDRIVMGSQGYAWMWKAFFECDATMEEYRRCSAVGGTNADLSGYVKMDPLAAELERARARKDGSRKNVLVALHHSVDGGLNDTLSLANFAAYADYFASLPDRYPSIQFTFRPHPFLMKALFRDPRWGEKKTLGYFARLRSKGNVSWSDGAGYFGAFAESDACIQDCGSWLVEYLYTGKPCCYMLKSPDDAERKFAPLGRECLGQCYVAYGTDAIDSFLRRVVLEGDDPKAAGRASLAASVAVNWPHAADAALSHIVSSIARHSSGI